MKSLIRILTKKKLKISFVESCTGGLLASSITSFSGASKVFNLGLIGKEKAIACEVIISITKYD